MKVLTDYEGKISAIRVMSFIALFAAIGFSYMVIKLDSEIGFNIIVLLVLSAFAPKTIQSYIERANPLNNILEKTNTIK